MSRKWTLVVTDGKSFSIQNIECPLLWTEEVIAKWLNSGGLPSETGYKPIPTGFWVDKIRPRLGGRRQNAGRPSGQGKYGCKTKAVRVPLEVADNLPELLSNLEQVSVLIKEYKVNIEQSNSPRYHFCKSLIAELESLGF